MSIYPDLSPRQCPSMQTTSIYLPSLPDNDHLSRQCPSSFPVSQTMSIYLPDNVHLSSNVSGTISNLVLGVDVGVGRQKRLDRRLVTLLRCNVHLSRSISQTMSIYPDNVHLSSQSPRQCPSIFPVSQTMSIYPDNVHLSRQCPSIFPVSQTMSIYLPSLPDNVRLSSRQCPSIFQTMSIYLPM